MRIVADEGVESSIVDTLRQARHDVVYIAELAPGVTDETVLALASARQALLITCDKDFGELVFRLRRAHTGVLLLRLAGLKQMEKAAATLAALTTYADELPGKFSVLDKRDLRIRTPID